MNIKWQALEHEDKEHSTDWFWALGVIVIAGSIAAIIFADYFFAMILVLGGIMLGYFATKKPEMVNYELNEKGLKINNELYPYKNMKSFWVQTEIKPILFLKLNRIIMHIISMPIEIQNAEETKTTMLENNITEEEMKEHVSEKIMETLGF